MNNNLNAIVVVALIATVLIGGFALTPSYGQAQTETQTLTIPLEGARLSGNCPNTEVVLVTDGTLRIISHTTLDPNGGFHGKAQVLFVNVRGIGETSGDEYQIISSSSSSTFASADGSPQVQTATGTTHITNGVNEKGKATTQFTVNANGEIKVNFVKFTVDCD